MFDPMNKAKWTSSLSDKVVKDVLHAGKVVDWDKKKVQYLAPLLPGKIVYKRLHNQDLLYCRAAWPTLPWPAVNFCPIGFKGYKWDQ
jgi:hypothetical protein